MDNLYSKLNPARPEVLNKLVEKGKTIDKENILKIYGDDVKKDGEGWDNQRGDGKGNSFGDNGVNGGKRERGENGKGDFGEKGERKYNITDNHFNQGGKGQGNNEDDS